MKRDVCHDCVEEGGCQLRAKLPKPVVRCDLYRKRKENPPNSEKDCGEAARGEGLCASCEIRQSCSRRKVEGGVWRCADYREAARP